MIKRSISKKRLPEIARYGIAGLATTAVNIAVYRLLLLILDYKISNLLAILASKAFAYAVNKLFVFRSRCATGGELLREIGRFILARGATGLFDYFGLMIAVDLLHFDCVWSKYGIQAMVIILNYVLGKLAVFKGKDSKGQDAQDHSP